MIIDFSVENFGSIRDRQTVSFLASDDTRLEKYYVVEEAGLRLLKIGLIYGANASGKSTILEALELLHDLILKPLNTKDEELEFEPFLLDQGSRFKNTLLEMRFVVENEVYRYNVELNKKYVVSESLVRLQDDETEIRIFERTTDVENKLADVVFHNILSGVDLSPEINILTGNILWNNTVFGGYVKTNVNIYPLNHICYWFVNYFMPVLKDKMSLTNFVNNYIGKGIDKDLVIKLLQKADFNISDLDIKAEKNKYQMGGQVFERTDFELKFVHDIDGEKYALPVEMESSGTDRYYGLAGILADILMRNRFLCIDEFETSLHPDLLEYFLLTYLVNANKSQMLVTTHMRELMMGKDILRRDAIWIVDKDKSGASSFYSVADFDDDFDVYEAYKGRRLGGVSAFDDYHINLQEYGEKK